MDYATVNRFLHEFDRISSALETLACRKSADYVAEPGTHTGV